MIMATPRKRPLSAESAPDPARSYERAKPDAESGMGRLDNNRNATPTPRADTAFKAVSNKHPSHQLNAHDVVDERAAKKPGDDAANEKPRMNADERG
jgi:hypothetical protein